MQAAHLAALLVAPGLGRAEQRGVPPARQELLAEAQLVVQSAQAELPPKDANRARDRAGCATIWSPPIAM